MLPLLSLIEAEGVETPMSQTVEKLATQFKLSEEERSELLPSGTQSV